MHIRRRDTAASALPSLRPDQDAASLTPSHAAGHENREPLLAVSCEITDPETPAITLKGRGATPQVRALLVNWIEKHTPCKTWFGAKNGGIFFDLRGSSGGLERFSKIAQHLPDAVAAASALGDPESVEKFLNHPALSVVKAIEHEGECRWVCVQHPLGANQADDIIHLAEKLTPSKPGKPPLLGKPHPSGLSMLLSCSHGQLPEIQRQLLDAYFRQAGANPQLLSGSTLSDLGRVLQWMWQDPGVSSQERQRWAPLRDLVITHLLEGLGSHAYGNADMELARSLIQTRLSEADERAARWKSSSGAAASANVLSPEWDASQRLQKRMALQLDATTASFLSRLHAACGVGMQTKIARWVEDVLERRDGEHARKAAGECVERKVRPRVDVDAIVRELKESGLDLGAIQVGAGLPPPTGEQAQLLMEWASASPGMLEAPNIYAHLIGHADSLDPLIVDAACDALIHDYELDNGTPGGPFLHAGPGSPLHVLFRFLNEASPHRTKTLLALAQIQMKHDVHVAEAWVDAIRPSPQYTAAHAALALTIAKATCDPVVLSRMAERSVGILQDSLKVALEAHRNQVAIPQDSLHDLLGLPTPQEGSTAQCLDLWDAICDATAVASLQSALQGIELHPAGLVEFMSSREFKELVKVDPGAAHRVQTKTARAMLGCAPSLGSQAAQGRFIQYVAEYAGHGTDAIDLPQDASPEQMAAYGAHSILRSILPLHPHEHTDSQILQLVADTIDQANDAFTSAAAEATVLKFCSSANGCLVLVKDELDTAGAERAEKLLRSLLIALKDPNLRQLPVSTQETLAIGVAMLIANCGSRIDKTLLAELENLFNSPDQPRSEKGTLPAIAAIAPLISLAIRAGDPTSEVNSPESAFNANVGSITDSGGFRALRLLGAMGISFGFSLLPGVGPILALSGATAVGVAIGRKITEHPDPLLRDSSHTGRFLRGEPPTPGRRALSGALTLFPLQGWAADLRGRIAQHLRSVLSSPRFANGAPKPPEVIALHAGLLEEFKHF